MTEPPCECPGPGFCPRYQLQQGPHAHALCRGDGVAPGKSEAYRRKWRLRLAGEEHPAPAPVPPPPRPQGGPGTELKRLLSSLGLEPGGCRCDSRAALMDAWGPDGCRANRAEIVAWLREERARRGWTGTLAAAARAVTSGLAFRLDPLDPLGSLVDEAVRRAAADS